MEQETMEEMLAKYAFAIFKLGEGRAASFIYKEDFGISFTKLDFI